MAGAVDLARYGVNGLFTSGACASGFSSYWPGPRAVFALDLGAGTQLGGTLRVTTCGATANNTVLYVGTGCPTWALPFNCRAGGDDAAEVAGESCASNPRASVVRLASASSRLYFIMLGGYRGEAVVSGLSWSYTLPSSATPSRSGTGTRSRSRSASATRSRSRKRKL